MPFYFGIIFYFLLMVDYVRSETKKILKDMIDHHDPVLKESLQCDFLERPYVSLKYPKKQKYE